MIKALNSRLEEKYPSLFTSLMIGPIECHDGWYDILDDCFAKLVALNAGIRLIQVKQKFYSLRIYISPHVEEASHIVAETEAKSVNICEFCGSPYDGTVATGPYWGPAARVNCVPCDKVKFNMWKLRKENPELSTIDIAKIVAE